MGYVTKKIWCWISKLTMCICSCVSPRIGAFIVAVGHIVGSIVGLALTVCVNGGAIILYSCGSKELTYDKRSENSVAAVGEQLESKFQKAFQLSLYTLSMGAILSWACVLVSALFLLLGILKKSRTILLGWAVLHMLRNSIWHLFFLSVVLSEDASSLRTMVGEWCGYTGVSITLTAFSVLIVRAYYLDIGGCEEMRQFTRIETGHHDEDSPPLELQPLAV